MVQQHFQTKAPMLLLPKSCQYLTLEQILNRSFLNLEFPIFLAAFQTLYFGTSNYFVKISNKLVNVVFGRVSNSVEENISSKIDPFTICT